MPIYRITVVDHKGFHDTEYEDDFEKEELLELLRRNDTRKVVVESMIDARGSQPCHIR